MPKAQVGDIYLRWEAVTYYVPGEELSDLKVVQPLVGVQERNIFEQQQTVPRILLKAHLNKRNVKLPDCQIAK